MLARAENPGQPTGGHSISHRSPTGGHDTFCGGQEWTGLLNFVLQYNISSEIIYC